MINQAQIKDDVLAKTNEIITEVNAQTIETNDHDSKIMQLLNWMGLVKDYVVETGSNANGRYEKWYSGKIKNQGVQNITLDSAGTGTITLPTPIPDATITRNTVLATPAWLSTKNISLVYHDLTTTTFKVTCTNFATTSPITGNQRISFEITYF